LRIAESVPDATGPQSSSSNTVTVTATTGTVPNVVGDSEASAVSAIQFAGFNPVKGTDVTSGATAQNNGTVASQTPSGGTTANLGTNVTYRLYAYTAATVPNVVGQTEATATTNISDAGLVTSVSYDSVGATEGNNGTVKSQSPAAGSSVAPNSTVAIVVYSFSLGLGKRMTGPSASVSIATAKRYDGSSWANLTIARRFDGTNWVNFTN
jgi:serine/threonine-protein kinase